ncbi:MAG: biotin transporter BioY [Synergistaceae bacterium]|nr:biotin transporter BioY [Synergistaceae bacterium]
MKKSLLLTSFFAVLTGVGGYMTIPMVPVPFTMQTFVVLMSGLLLGPKYGPLSQVLYVAMGLLGLPVFAGGRGGPHYLFSPTFGFLAGGIFMSWFTGWWSARVSAEKKGAARHYSLVCLAASAALYIVALPCFYLNMNYVTGAEMSFLRAVQVAFLPFVLPDAVKAVAAGWLASRTIPLLRGAGLLNAKDRK